jgi:hypothetical protein
VVNEAKEFKDYDLEEAEMVVLFSLNALIDIGMFRKKISKFAYLLRTFYSSGKLHNWNVGFEAYHHGAAV